MDTTIDARVIYMDNSIVHVTPLRQYYYSNQLWINWSSDEEVNDRNRIFVVNDSICP